MNIEEFRDYCLKKKGVTEEFPFDETTLVFKVLGKMFALTDTEESFRINLKCDPELVDERREKYASVIPGYHMNKKHWNTIIIDDTISDALLLEWIDDSYELVIGKMTRKQQNELKNL